MGPRMQGLSDFGEDLLEPDGEILDDHDHPERKRAIQ